jgi:hypothetical protein
MTDLISRQAAIDAFGERPLVWDEWTDEFAVGLRNQYDYDVAAIKSLPPAQQWIPCSESLPEDDTLVLVNYIDHRPDAMDIWIGWHEMENVWYIDGEEHSRERGNEVIAWMPLPEPYKKESEDETH